MEEVLFFLSFEIKSDFSRISFGLSMRALPLLAASSSSFCSLLSYSHLRSTRSHIQPFSLGRPPLPRSLSHSLSPFVVRCLPFADRFMSTTFATKRRKMSEECEMMEVGEGGREKGEKESVLVEGEEEGRRENSKEREKEEGEKREKERYFALSSEEESLFSLIEDVCRSSHPSSYPRVAGLS